MYMYIYQYEFNVIARACQCLQILHSYEKTQNERLRNRYVTLPPTGLEQARQIHFEHINFLMSLHICFSK